MGITKLRKVEVKKCEKMHNGRKIQNECYNALKVKKINFELKLTYHHSFTFF